MYKQIRHSCFDLNYHLILITKHRYSIIKGSIAVDLKDYIFKYFNNNKILIKEYVNNLDHIHIVFEGKPNLNLANFINGLKTNSSKYIRKKHKEKLSLYYKEPYFWNSSYFIGGANEKSKDVIKKYIENQ